MLYVFFYHYYCYLSGAWLLLAAPVDPSYLLHCPLGAPPEDGVLWTYSSALCCTAVVLYCVGFAVWCFCRPLCLLVLVCFVLHCDVVLSSWPYIHRWIIQKEKKANDEIFLVVCGEAIGLNNFRVSRFVVSWQSLAATFCNLLYVW